MELPAAIRTWELDHFVEVVKITMNLVLRASCKALVTRAHSPKEYSDAPSLEHAGGRLDPRDQVLEINSGCLMTTKISRRRRNPRSCPFLPQGGPGQNLHAVIFFVAQYVFFYRTSLPMI
jgi:hypothetical protein